MIHLCRTPRAEPDGFHEDVERIATRYEPDPAALVQVLRQVVVVTGLRQWEPA
jgi:hypothetical protein